MLKTFFVVRSSSHRYGPGMGGYGPIETRHRPRDFGREHYEGIPDPATGSVPGGIVMCYNLPDTLPPEDRPRIVFNLFSCFGYVSKVKILHKKENSAAIQ